MTEDPCRGGYSSSLSTDSRKLLEEPASSTAWRSFFIAAVPEIWGSWAIPAVSRIGSEKRDAARVGSPM